jgi:hypothetical protein
VSYDLYLVRSGTSAPAAAQLVLENTDADDPNPGPIDPAAEERKSHLVAALRRVNIGLEPFIFDYAEIARLQSASEDEARRRWRHIELNGPDDGNGIQITLNDETVTVTVPYWHRGVAADGVWEEIWRYLHVLCTEGRFDVYDPQLDRMLQLQSDFSDVVAAYGRGVGVTERAVGGPKKPWWRFW